MNDMVRETWPEKPRVSTATISRALHGSLITVKQTRNIPVNRNSATTKQHRERYAAWMLNTGMAMHRVYVDETGLNLHLSRSRGRAQVGERAARVVCGQRGRNMTVILAISDRVGVVYYEIVWGGVDVERFRVSLENLSVVLDLKQRLGQVQGTLDDRGAALAAGHRGIGTWRSAILEELADQAMAAITQEKVAAAYQHANAFIGACLAREDIWAE
ncbi:hypothetical protein FJT64_014245 [Amphibalanus amphitrite]|uniref:Tc1-like transposase DDE domain-containing protein n=1 Tax=Amphibalanus amphitrite TaxID=1232801 RepID=A0A6A4V012_AMPAM|nr:hypothetical protein FJT64_014245 [Amphibalanus amphitrite]